MQIERNRLKKFQLARVGGYLQAMIDDLNSRWPIQQVVGAGLEPGTARFMIASVTIRWNETSSAVFSHGTIYLVRTPSNFWVCGWNPVLLAFKWNLFNSTFTW